jgi:phage gp16-like protein
MSRRAFNPELARKRKLAAIHAEKKALDLDDATYRALLERITGHRSAADCTLPQLAAVIAELHRLSGKPLRAIEAAKGYAGKPKVMTPLLQKIEALLADASRPWSYGHHLAKRMFKAQRVEWLNADQQHRLVAALQIDADRRARRGTN